MSAIKVASRNGVKPFRDGSVSIDTVVARLKVGSLARRVSTFLRRRIGNEIRLLQTTASSLNPRARELVLRADKARDDADVAAQSHDTLEIARAITQLRSADSLLAIAEREDRAWLGPLIDRGWVALTIANLQSGAPRDSAFGSAMGHAARALGRNTRNAGALELRGTVFYSQAALLPLADTKFDDYLGRAAQDLEAALRVDSALASAWGTLSRVHVARGHVADAEQAARTALAMDAYVKDAPSILQTLSGRHSCATVSRPRGRGASADQRIIHVTLVSSSADSRSSRKTGAASLIPSSPGHWLAKPIDWIRSRARKPSGGLGFRSTATC